MCDLLWGGEKPKSIWTQQQEGAIKNKKTSHKSVTPQTKKMEILPS